MQAGLADGEGVTFERFLESVHADDRGSVRQAIQRVVGEGERVDIEYRTTVDSRGEVRWISARGEADRGPDGKPQHVRGVTIDVTSQKRKDAELQQQRDQLAHIQRVSALGQLSSALAHEISQPLGAMLRNAEAGELFLKKAPPDLDELSAILAYLWEEHDRPELHRRALLDSAARFRLLSSVRAGGLHAGQAPSRDVILELCGSVHRFLRTLAIARRMAPYLRNIPAPQEPAVWASPALPDTFGKLMNLLEVSDAEKAIYGGVQGRGGALGML